MPTMNDVQPHEVKAFRENNGLTQQEFADLIGSKKRTVEDWEGGRRAVPAMLRLAMAAVKRGIEPWIEREPKHPRELTFDDAIEAANERILEASRDWAEIQWNVLSHALAERRNPAEALMLGHLIVAKDGYSDLDYQEKWAMRPRSGWRVSFAFRPELENGAIPTFAFEVRYENMASYLVVFVDASYAERQPERLQLEQGLVTLGYRVMTVRASEVLEDVESVVENVTGALFEMNEGHLITLGFIKPPKPRTQPNL